MKKGFLKNRIKALLAAVLVAVFAVSALPALPLLASPTLQDTPQSQDARSRQAREIMDNIISRRPTTRPGTSNIIINGLGPRVRNIGTDDFFTELDRHFTTQISSFIQSHQASALSLRFTTEVFHTGTYPNEYISVFVSMQANGASVTTVPATTVIRVTDREVITLADYAPNIIPLVNNRIRDIISERPRNFVANFPGIDDSHPFYLRDDRLVIPFASARLRLGERGIFSVSLNTDNIQHVVVEDNQMQTLPPDQYNTLMMQLFTIHDNFGYATPWNSATQSIRISSPGGDYITTVTIGQNLYTCRNGVEHTLEAAPILRSSNSRTYVPLSFFEKIMGIPTTLMPDGSVIISKYDASGDSVVPQGPTGAPMPSAVPAGTPQP
ncbi:MAG: stalk domain-containing protein [Defluviitaleaceae bacterium]|nr:stalk domain-containing protein [Defluviitaleaceae bacterium]